MTQSIDRPLPHALQDARADHRIRGRPWRAPVIVAAYLAAYVALDWVSFIHPVAGLAITPWNPPPGLTLFLLLRFGLRFLPAALVAPYVADVLVRDVAALSWLTLAGSLPHAAGYAAAGWALAGPLRLGREIATVRDATRIVAVALVAPALVAAAYVGLHYAAGSLTERDTPLALLQFWIGDAIGIVVTTPLLLVLATSPRAMPKPRLPEIALQAAAVALALWIVFGVAAGDGFRFFYLLFIPVVWVAMRHGLRGAVVASLAIQLGLLAAADASAVKDSQLRDLQLLMLTLALTSLYLGVAVTERSVAQRALAAREAAHQRGMRMAAAGELAAAVAHELNQPLAAIGMYVRASALLAGRAGESALLRETLDKAGAEVKRAGDVIRRLREFYRTGSGTRERIAARSLVDLALEALSSRIDAAQIAVRVDDRTDGANVDVDPGQMRLVVHNVLANALDAIASTAPGRGRINVELRRTEDRIVIAIADTGPGVPAGSEQRLFEAFATTKPEGMGLGLAISRSIAEAHGGGLALASTTGSGARFHLTLPVAADDASTQPP